MKLLRIEKGRQRFLLTLLMAMGVGMNSYSQTNMTSYITNPSFENEMTGWTHKGMGTQGNNVFDIKDGNTYVEKWTGRGGAVGDGSVRQTLQGLPPGNYELTAAAQNIQEDTPTANQTGAYIFADDNQTAVSARNTYKVAFTCVTGKVTIGFEAIGASGNWIAVDNFRLTLVGQDLTNELKAAIEEALELYGDGSGREAEQLKAAIEAAQAVVDNPEGDAQAKAIVALMDATEKYRLANASEDNPLDMTSLIINPSFENDGLNGWTSNMSTQGNNVFNIKDGNIYVEKWTGRGGAVGDAYTYQVLTNMRPGRYQLKAAAQNIQEDTPRAAQTGAWIYGNSSQAEVTVRQEYTLDFVLVSDKLELGFKAENASGNWIAVDNFRLLYLSDDMGLIKTEFENLIAKAEALASQKTNNNAHKALQDAIDNAKEKLSSNSTDEWPAAASKIEAAYKTAEASQKIFARLKAAIDEANNELATSSASDKADYQTAINKAQATYDGTNTTDAQAEAAIEALAKASFAFRIANSSGTAPKVTTDTRFIRGATWAFGRSTVSGSNIIEEGFCWSENPDPKVTDNRTTEYISQAGKIYWMRDLKPATVYYIRAYALTKDYAVGYGDVIKCVTVPKGTIGHWYNNGGDEEVNDRINYAINTAMDYYWNNLSSIHGFGISVSYSPGTPTADCSYGGSMRVGASASYQQVGTIMHEALHGIGVGTHGMWWNGDMRSDGDRGDWLGDRVTEAVRFWDNNTTGRISGDTMHLWPYGCNGAHEDSHSDNLYCMMGILAQALNEDGLPGSGEIGYALPYYSFNHEDGVKYYIKNEDESRGLYTSYLVEAADHTLQWKQMSAEEAQKDDAAAWYITFTPSNQYYQLKNAASGYYMTYTSGTFKTINRSNPTNADNIHLMRGRVDITSGKTTFRGYYFIHPESNSNPPVMIANAGGKTGSTAFNIERSAKQQRWLILSAKDMDEFENGATNEVRSELEQLLAQIRKLAQTPHTEEKDGADIALETELASIESQKDTNNKTLLNSLITQAKAASITFLESVSASDIEHPFDLTYMLQNPDFDTDATTGWTTTVAPAWGSGAAEFYEKTFNIYQTLTDMPIGVYDFRVLAFQRPGEIDAVYTKYAAGNSKVTTTLYISSEASLIKNICDDSQPTALYNDGGWGSDKKLGDGTYAPNCMEGASRYFAKGLYENTVMLDNTKSGATFKVGLRCTSAPSYYWTMFDHFRLYFYGQNQTVTGIDEKLITNAEESELQSDKAWFTIDGRRLSGKPNAKGIYIHGNQKVMIK